MLDISLLLCAISPNSPCGEDLEYDVQFLELERDAQGKPERAMGDSVQPAEPPQWRQIEQSSIALLQRSKDLRITHYLLQSAVALHGFAGLTNALTLISDLLRQYWPALYPQLDADDDNDPTLRINALSGITCDTNLRLLRDSLLPPSRSFGPISLRAALNASRLQSFPDEQLSLDELKGALRDSDPAHLTDLRSMLQEAHSRADAIEQLVSAQVGSAQGVDLSALQQLIKQALHILREYVPDSVETEAQAHQSSSGETTETPAVVTSAPHVCDGEIDNRHDVVRNLDRILGYYARHEPSSPLPVLLNRAKNLVHADFAAIVRNLIPDGMPQFENLRGPDLG